MLAISLRSCRQKYIPRDRLKLVLHLPIESNKGHKPIEMREVRAGPANGWSINDGSHLAEVVHEKSELKEKIENL